MCVRAHIYIHAYIHTYIRTYVHTYILPCMNRVLRSRRISRRARRPSRRRSPRLCSQRAHLAYFHFYFLGVCISAYGGHACRQKGLPILPKWLHVDENGGGTSVLAALQLTNQRTCVLKSLAIECEAFGSAPAATAGREPGRWRHSVHSVTARCRSVPSLPPTVLPTQNPTSGTPPPRCCGEPTMAAAPSHVPACACSAMHCLRVP